MHWYELTKIALLGTENTSFPPSSLQRLEALGVATSQEPARLLAEAVALLAQFRKAGFFLEKFDGDLPERPKEGVENASPKTVRHLQLILSGGQLPVLPEFLHLLQRSGKKLPASELPQLMLHPDLQLLWPQIEPRLGEDGRWLLRQHPDWQNRLQDPQQFNWQTGTREQRMAMLHYWRQHSPSFALELLASTWESENPVDKANFLPLLAVQISEDDEAFLEKCLDDRRKEVRMAAPPLLARIGASRFSKRMQQRLANCLTLQSNSLKINLFESPDLAMLRDGILQIHPGWPGGAKAGFLGQMMSWVSPVHWETYFSRPPAEVLALFAMTDWAETLVRATLEAAALHRNAAWAEALMIFWQQNETMAIWEQPVCNQLAKLLNPAAVNRLAVNFLGETTTLPAEASPVFRMLKHSEANWSHELSLLVLSRFRQDIVRDYRQMWQLQHLKEYLQLLGLRSDPGLFEQFQTGWSHDSVQWRMWEKLVDEMLTRVLFRREMRAAFSTGNA